jgi:hypothetical protein
VNEAIARVDPQDVNPVRHGLRYVPVQEFQRADAHEEQQNAPDQFEQGNQQQRRSGLADCFSSGGHARLFVGPSSASGAIETCSSWLASAFSDSSAASDRPQA